MNTNFSELGIMPEILKALEEIGFEQPTEVQSKAIPHILNKEDMIVKSKTGSGKTAVFGIPILQLTDPGQNEPQGLILTPTRELAVQVDSDLKQFSKYLKHKTTAVYGQHSMNVEIQAMEKGVSIVTGTPGRVFDHIQHGKLVTSKIRFLVLDEADRMLDMGFIDQVLKIIKTIPKNRITMLFSATIPPEIHRICRDYMKNPMTIEIESATKTVDAIKQVYYRVEHNEKRTQLNRLLLSERPESCMIFCNTKHAVDNVQSFLTRKGYASEALHGDIAQGRRLKTIQHFKKGDFRILVATDVAARGIHIDSLSLVINYDVPNEKDSYVHRIGRTGRAGNDGLAITMTTSEDIMSLYEIEEHIGAMISEGELPTDADLNAHKDEADLWIEANKLKTPIHDEVPHHSSRPTARKPAHKNPANHDRKPDNKPTQPKAPQRDRSEMPKSPSARPPHHEKRAETKHTHTAPRHPVHPEKRKDTAEVAGLQRERIAPRAEAAITTQDNKAKPVIIKTTQRVIGGGGAPQTKPSPEPTQVESTQKKPFLKRLVDRITGK